MFGQLGNLGALLRQAQQFGTRLNEVGDDLKAKRITGSAGGGMVEVDVNGLQEVLACRIEPGLFAQQDRELVEELVRAAVNQALSKARQMHAEAMKNLAGGVDLPGLDEALAKLSGNPAPDE